ncbi:uncharacterized protein DUF4874 [Cellulophaga sp. RHA19]|uniref:DUF4832 domain-containing protein n=1 Tax=Cellulophaga sp. RHA19 TaxID=1798237 RepID=UPI000CA9BE7A|nr:DUF4832 domain-containing protein [Cellulophaga sp. RHA19]PKB44819.1 uncharacterized protein DUF4874 [Cellulophaga sp. RHA19]
MKNRILALTLLIMVISCSSSSSGDDEVIADDTLSEIKYTESLEVISNPERGFMHSWSVLSEGDPLSLVTLNSLKNENVTIILRLYYLDAFKNSDLSEVQLNLIKTDFERLREAGIKCVLRFAYNSNSDETDAPLNIIENHLDQLKPIVSDNADVIAFVQAGFIGSWGEWAFSTNNLTTTESRKAVVNKLLDVFPKEVKIQLRTPKYKQEVFDYTNAIDETVGYGTTDIARVGFHNDCFLASVDDYGTYQNVTIEKSYISDEASFVPTGGETCPPSGIPTASCATAEEEMTLLKWTYLNLDWYGPVLNVWRNNSCFVDFQKKLGYRLVLKSAELQKKVTASSNFNLNAVISNVGYAPVYNQKNTFLVLKATDGTLYKKALNFDVRKVLPNVDLQLNESVALTGIPAGKYDLFLKIEDQSSKLADRPEYAIQLANIDTWNALEGLNKLSHTLTIN